jgi:hypothetical protein
VRVILQKAVTDGARSGDRRERQTEEGVWVMETLGNRNMGKKYNRGKRRNGRMLRWGR